MKLVLSRDMAAERARGRAAIEAIFMPRLEALLTVVSGIRALKAAEADKLGGATGVKTSPLLKPEAKMRGVPETTLAQMIRAKRDAKNAELAATEVARQEAQAAIDAATSPAAIDAVIERYR